MTNQIQRATKIVATIGPASRNVETLGRMMDAGLNVVRMNFSHGSHEDHRETYNMVRNLAREKGITVGILQDLQGPKIRVGTFKDGPVMLVKGEEFILTSEVVDGTVKRATTQYAGLVQDVRPGMKLLLDDGNLELEVVRVEGQDILTTVVIGGKLSDKKGINVPEAALSVPALAAKDREDLAFGAELGVDWVALSFVRSREDMLDARAELAKYGSKAKLMAKIEKPTAVERFAEILAESDGIMVARGDLGVECLPEDVPIIQKKLIRACREANKPVITATQMLESMRENPRPTRAEASDVANAIMDGTDAVMLSAESASGMYPVESVQMMDRIARATETSEQYRMELNPSHGAVRGVSNSMADAACDVARALEAKAIVCFTATGTSVFQVSSKRPPTPIVGTTPNEGVKNQLALCWGVIPMLAPEIDSTERMAEIADGEIRQLAFVGEGDRYVIIAGLPFGQSGSTNMVRVERVKAL
jgi:pyruvate kinase